MMFCVNCGNPISENARFCPECGQPVANVPEIMAVETAEPPEIPNTGAAVSTPANIFVPSLKDLKCPQCGSGNLRVTGVKGALGKSFAVTMAFGAIGNMVAGSNAAKDTETHPLQYKCEGCGNKFESYPLPAPQGEILTAPCTVTLERVSSFVGAGVPQIVYINGVKVGPVKNGKSIVFQTGARYNDIFVTDHTGVAFKSEYKFEAQPGGSVFVRFNRKFV